VTYCFAQTPFVQTTNVRSIEVVYVESNFR